MPVGFTQVRTAIQVRLQTIDGLRVHDTAPGQVVAPVAIVLPGEPVITYDATMARGSDDLQVVVRLLVAQGADYASQAELDKYLAGSGAHSVKAAVDSDLDGLVSFARVAAARNYGEFDHGGTLYLGVEFVVEVTS